MNLFQKTHSAPRHALALALVPSLFFAGNALAGVKMAPGMIDARSGSLQLPVRKSALQHLIDRIPANAEILTSPHFLPHFSDRKSVSVLGEAAAPVQRGESPKFALVDLGGSGTDLKRADSSAAMMREWMKAGWGPVESFGGVVLFSDRPGEGFKTLFVTVDPAVDKPYLTLDARARRFVMLTGFTMNPDARDPDVIHFSFYWKKTGEDPGSHYVELSIVDASGKQVYSVHRRLCYGLYPFTEWKVGETVKDEFSFVVPERLKNSSYEVRLALRDPSRAFPEPMQSPVAGALDDQGRVRLIALDAI